jgi:hypothetical protein
VTIYSADETATKILTPLGEGTAYSDQITRIMDGLKTLECYKVPTSRAEECKLTIDGSFFGSIFLQTYQSAIALVLKLSNSRVVE